jgi:nucleoside-diphosphate-sugar epimerase
LPATALVTGASGFIGRALVARLREAGYGVTCLVRESAAAPDGFDLVRLKTFDRDAIRGVFRDRTFDVVFHLAAYGVSPKERDPALMLSVNVELTANLVMAASASNVRAFIYAGSCAEYRTTKAPDRLAEESPLSATHLYGASKAAGGLFGHGIAAGTDLSHIWLRLFGVYGAGEAPHRLLPSLIRDLAQDKPVALSPGRQVRDFLYRDDVVDGFLAAAAAALGGRRGVYNLCSGNPLTVSEFAIAVAEHLGKSRTLLDFGALPYRPDEDMWLLGNPDKFRELTGFVPRYSIAEGISRALAECGF